MSVKNDNIPTKFTLGAVEWSIKLDNKRLDDLRAYGYCEYDRSLITIQSEVDKEKRSQTAIEQTMYHEVVHSILDTLGKNDLSKDEEFVQSFSLLLHQFEKTKK